MQLGAALAFAPKTTPEGTVSKPKVMVPAAVDAFVSPDRAPRAHAFAASTETAKVTANSRTSNHRLTPRVGGASVAALRGLVVKEMRAGGAAPTVSTRSKPTPGSSGGKGSGRIATSADAPPRVTYAVEWLARAPVAPSDGPTIRARSRSAAKMLLPKSQTVEGFRSRTPARSVALAATLQNAGALAVRSSTRTADAAVGAEGAFPVASRASAAAAAAHGTIRAAAQELRRTQMDAFDVDPFETDAGVDVDPFARDPTSLGAAREATSRGARILEPVLRARPLAGATFASTRAIVSPRHSPPPGRLAVLIRARSVRLADALIREEGTRTGLVGFAGTVADPGETRVAETGTAVFGLLRREDDLEGGDVDSFRLVDASLCALKPSWMSFERAAAIPEPHVRAEAYLRVAVSRQIANDNGPIIVALPDERRGCAVSAAMAARLDDIGATWIESARRFEDEDDGDAEDERKPSVILGAFDDENDVAAALAAVREGGALVKTSTRTRWCSEATRAMFGEMVSHKHDRGARLSGFGSAWRSALFLDDESRAARENRPDVDFVDVNLDDVADAASAAVSWLASALARSAPTSSRPIAIASARENAANSFFRDSNAFSNATSFVRASARADADHLDADKTFVVTGGLGAIGVAFAAWLARRYPARVHLLSRSGRSSRVGQDLGASAGAVTVHRADAARREETAHVGRRLRVADGTGVGHALHAAGVLRDAMLPSQTAGGIREVSSAKVSASDRLAAATRFEATESSVMFSSIAALLGSAGQTNYSGANAALDRAASAARETGAVASSVQWGAWGAVGMAAQNEGVLGRIERMGMGVLRPEDGVAALAAALSAATNVAASPFAWERLAKVLKPPPAMCVERIDEAVAEEARRRREKPPRKRSKSRRTREPPPRVRSARRREVPPRRRFGNAWWRS